MICKLLGKSSDKVEQSLWQTLGQTDLLHPLRSGYRKCCHVGKTASECILSLFQDSDSASDLTDSKSMSDAM